jgi:3-phenylpropionate/trans-cinnamate dioxygenase ferredoxin subunit
MKHQSTVSQREKVVVSNFVPVARTSEIPIGKMKTVKFLDIEILIANVNGTYHAIGNKCTHANGDLSQGVLEGNTVTCPKHSSKFDVTNGTVVAPPKIGFFRPKIHDEPSYSVKVEGENVLIRV